MQEKNNFDNPWDRSKDLKQWLELAKREYHGQKKYNFNYEEIRREIKNKLSNPLFSR